MRCVFPWIAVLLIMAGCSLLGTAYPPLPQLIGAWEWDVSTGGFAGIRLTPDSTGYTIRLTFHTKGAFVWHRSDQPPITGHYRLFQRNGDWYVRYTPSAHRFMPEQRIQFPAPDTLLLHDQCDDCFSHRFHRVQ